MRIGMIVTVVVLVSSALVSGAVLYGREHPSKNSLREFGFGLCEGKPCLMNMMPQKTSWQAVMDKFSSDASLSLDGDSVLSVNVGTNTLRIFNTWGENRVSAVQVNTSPEYTLREVLDLYGTPCNIANWYGGDPEASLMQLWLYYPTMAVQVVPTEHLQPTTPVSRIYLINDPRACTATAFGDNSRWIGFISRQAYVARNRDR